MRYRVTWDPDAFRALVGIWTAAGNPAEATESFDQIESILSRDADQQGESRTQNLRILIVPPLGVVFEAFPDSGEVIVVDAWLIRPKRI